MADGEPTGTAEETPQIAFLVKSSNDTKYPVSMPGTATIADLKQKLSASEFADTPAGAKIKDGHTVHLVKSAASNVRQNPVSQSSSSGTPAANVPTNIAAGTGNNPLAALTGARYAGFHGLPSLQSFGADGGVRNFSLRGGLTQLMLTIDRWVRQA